MPALFQRYATPFITGLFLVSLISGIALFVHLGANYFRGMHEWLSMVLILPFALHLWKNWRSMTVYFKKPAFMVAIAGSSVAALAFAIPASSSKGNGGPPQFVFAHTMLANSPAKLAPLLGVDADTLVAKLKAKGFTAAASDMALTDIANRSGKDEFALITELVAKQ